MAGIVTAVIVAYCFLLLFRADFLFIEIVFFAFPPLMLWLVYTVLRHGKYDGKELQEDEEWGYEDKKKEDLGMF